MDALGGIQSTTGYDSRPGNWITVWFEGSTDAMFTGGTFIANGGKSLYAMNAQTVDSAIQQATLILDTWGSRS